MADNGQVTLTINGREVKAPPGRLLIDVAEERDIFVPRFCYHPGLESVAACRMCLVEIEGSRKPLDPACATYIADGMVVRTNSEAAVAAQESVLELLLINHPLDCPICDRGGECPLQDQALNFGPGSSRYKEEKRHYPKPLPISDLVMLDRERCVLCWRCVRFCEEVSGDTFIDLMDRGSLTQINTAVGKPFDSYFSGNTIQICPVGALTSSAYRFLSRPWDLLTTESTCSYCSVGCPISIEARGGEVMRAQALPNENVNSFWNCDKGRFGQRYASNPERLRSPLIRKAGPTGRQEFVETTWDEALDKIAARLSVAPESVGLIAGSHLSNEDLYAGARLFRDVVGTRNVDFRIVDAGYPYDSLGGSTARIDDLDTAATIVWMGPDPKEELPVLYLRIRRAVTKGTRLLVVNPRRISLARLGKHSTALPAIDDIEGPTVVCIGQQYIGRDMSAAIGWMRELEDAKVLVCPPNANSQGAFDMGLLPRQGGLDTAGMLEAAAARRLNFLWVAGADLTRDFPDANLVTRAFASETFIVASELFPTETALAANVILPAASAAEKEGTFTNLERRIQKLGRAVSPPGVARADWQIFSEVAARIGKRWDWSSAADVAAEIAKLPTHQGFSWDVLGEPVASLAEAAALPPEVGHAAGESGRAEGENSAERPLDSRRPQISEQAWPLRWELRAVDATRRSGWIPQTRGSVTAVLPHARTPAPSAGYPLLLLVARGLYDGGQMISRSPELRNLIHEPFVELNPTDARARGLEAGNPVTVSSDRGSLTVPLRISDDTPPGSAFMLFDQPGAQTNVLMNVARAATFVEVTK